MRFWRTAGLFVVVLAVMIGSAEAQWRSALYYGGSGYEHGGPVAFDPAGNVYFLGQTASTDMDPAIVPDGDGLKLAAFIYKVSRQGTPIRGVTLGTGAMRPLDLAVGADGSVHALLIDGQNTRYVVRLDSDGRELFRVTFNPYTTQEYPAAIAVEPDGSTIVAGGKAQEGPSVMRIDSRGVVSDVYRVRSTAIVNDVAIDAGGNIYLFGTARASDLPMTAAAHQPQVKTGDCPHPENPVWTYPCTDVFVLKLTRQGSVVYGTYFGGAGADDARTIIVDGAGAAIIAGMTFAADLPLVAPIRTACTRFLRLPCGEGYLAKLDPGGSSVVFSTFLGANPVTLAADAEGTVYIGGSAGRDSGLPMYRAPQPAFGGGDSDAFVSALSARGELLWSTFVGGSREEAIYGIGVIGVSVYFGGATTSPDLTSAPFRGGRDLFLGGVSDPNAEERR